MPDAQTRHTRGLTIVIILGVIFFALLSLLILRSGKKQEAPPPTSETLSVLSLRLRLRTQPIRFDGRCCVAVAAPFEADVFFKRCSDLF